MRTDLDASEDEACEEEVNEDEASEEDQAIDEKTLTDVALKPPRCAICKAAMKALQHMVRHHTDKGEIARDLAQVCHKLGRLQNGCEQIINEHGAQIIDQMIKHTPVKIICKAIPVCRSRGTLEVDCEYMEHIEYSTLFKYKLITSLFQLLELRTWKWFKQNILNLSEKK